jgi:hypothetical protein
MKVHANLTVRASDGRSWTTGNVVTSGGLELIRDYLAAERAKDAPNPPSYVAFGSTALSAGRFLTAVPSEVFRTPIVQREAVGEAVVFHWFLSDTDASGETIATYGLFAGSANAEADSGTLVAIANEPSPFEKDGSLSYSGDWRMTISGSY